MRNKLSKLPFYNLIRTVYRLISSRIDILFLKNKLNRLRNDNKDIKVIIGSANTSHEGWVSTNEYSINLVDINSFLKFFKYNEVDNFLAEHVFEHLTYEQGIIGAQNCYKFLKKNGRFRIAVPDGYNPNQEYINYVKPGGNGPGCDDHKILYNYRSLSEVFLKAGFKVEKLEYFDENNNFQNLPWDINEGFIKRSFQYDERNKEGRLHYTSVIIDAVKV